VHIETGNLLSALIFGVLLASGVAWVVAGLYRRRMLTLMRGGAAPDDAQAAQPETAGTPPNPPLVQFDLAANRRSEQRFLLALSGLCLIIGLTHSWLALHFVYKVDGFSLNRLLILGAVYAWPMVLAWGMARRWSWLQVMAGVIAYMAVMAMVVMLGSNEQQSMGKVGIWLIGVVAIPILVTLFISASGRIRAIAPYLLPPFLILSVSTHLVLQLMANNVQEPPAWLYSLVGTLGAYGTILFLALAPWLLLAWPVYALGRWLANAYRNKRFSDLAYLFAAYWFVVLVSSTLPAVQGEGLAGLTQLLPWLWIPVAWMVLPVWLKPDGQPPTLLVLRVFQKDVQVETLFDRVIERWRHTGNTVLIAGTDLISRTLDPDDLFAFINRQLADRFIASETEIPQRIAGFDMHPDPDGRYRVNECYCFDTTWQAALRALVQASDVVLMDLRGFKPENRGCRFELGVLAKASNVRKVVLLFNAHTARDAAESDIVAAPPGRFVWLEAGNMDSAKAKQALSALFNHTGNIPSRNQPI
jgi:hypothetical protein